MKYLVTADDRPIVVEIDERDGELLIRVNGAPMTSSIAPDREQNRFLMLLNSRSYDTEVYHNNGVTSVFLVGREFSCTVEDERLTSLRKAVGLRAEHPLAELRAPMPGLVVKLLRSAGDQVEKGESLLIVEAMKMENELRSPARGTIKDIHVQTGKAVDKGQVLVTIES